MDLRCRHAHMAGRGVLVNGTVYQVGADGIVENVSATDAAKLLSAGDAWSSADGKIVPASNPEPVAKPAKPASPPVKKPDPKTFKPKLFGGKLPPQDDPWPAEDEAAPTEGVVEDPPAEDPGPTEKAETEEPGEEVPEPSMKMKKSELQTLADQYDVKYTDDMTKRELLELLEDAMYE